MLQVTGGGLPEVFQFSQLHLTYKPSPGARAIFLFSLIITRTSSPVFVGLMLTIMLVVCSTTARTLLTYLCKIFLHLHPTRIQLSMYNTFVNATKRCTKNKLYIQTLKKALSTSSLLQPSNPKRDTIYWKVFLPQIKWLDGGLNLGPWKYNQIRKQLL